MALADTDNTDNQSARTRKTKQSECHCDQEQPSRKRQRGESIIVVHTHGKKKNNNVLIQDLESQTQRSPHSFRLFHTLSLSRLVLTQNSEQESDFPQLRLHTDLYGRSGISEGQITTEEIKF